VYGRRAADLLDALRQDLGEVEAVINEEKPRRGSFEITLLKEDDSEVLVWTGLKKGPPRKTKFPEADIVLKEIQKSL